MFTCSRFLVRAAPSSLVREISSNFRNNLSHSRHNFLSVSAAIFVAAATNTTNSSHASEPIKKNTKLSNVEVTFCGFPKDLVAGPSCVVGCDVFGDDACFIANFKSAYVAGMFNNK